MHKIVQAKAAENYRVELVFDDGTRGTADLSGLAGRGVFTLWNDYAEFRKVSIGESGELVWSNQIDLCPDSLYLKVTGKSAEEVFPALRREMAHA
jgi:Protein of unknown function (DUF2442)